MATPYETYLVNEKHVSENTIEAYKRDLYHFEAFLKERGVNVAKEASKADVMAYVMELKAKGVSESTLNRKLASLRTYYNYLKGVGEVTVNPTENIKSPKVERKEIEYISMEEIDKLMSLPDRTQKGIRDRAILELLYATGIRASELIDMKVDDVNIRMGFVTLSGAHSKARIIPFGRLAKAAMEDYMLDVRRDMLKEHETDSLFVNYVGEPLTRQGLWKVLKEYGEKAELAVKLTPQVIRNSFAVHMLQNGADIKSLQTLMGHEDIAATQAYLVVTKNRIKDVYNKTHPRA